MSEEVKEKKSLITQEDIMKILETCYQKSLNGIKNVSPSVEDFANNYLNKHETVQLAAKSMIKNQIVKCTTSGFLTGLGGIVTLPVTIPANIGSLLYIQMRMIACTAYMGGYDLESDQTQTLVYACLAGVAVNQIFKLATIKFGVKLGNSMIKKIPGRVLTKINQKVGFKFITKFGTKGIVNLWKLLPGVGGVVGGGLDLVETKVIGNRAYKWFIDGDYTEEKEAKKKSEENNGIANYDSDLDEETCT